MTNPTTEPPAFFVLAPDSGRTPEPLDVVGEATLVKVSASDSEGQLALFHLTAPPLSGPPLHVHTREDEVFYVLEGELVFEIDGARHTVSAGGTVYLRRGVPHRYQNFTSTAARLLIAVTPGWFQECFVALSAATRQAGGLPSMDVLRSIDEPYGITTLGPPMTC